eukprot:Gregarina_sp_Poly_1__5104@NODE_2701_length_1809_cov_354_987371_g1714_i0_p1_GENE_NODE_2701_length_1809_cov_354_987371_g1714_i0NODE_2701_length_1809_cov_354_987371_g1714_i0_p1_ORF_typecomplete_len253_score40_85GATA/PF00320_27/0_00071FAM60A/PF15396_6/1_1e03FAM60A/PF15396_6/0_32_NODE_2701_length_1809_cov_354_987371_g1714_i09631721
MTTDAIHNERRIEVDVSLLESTTTDDSASERTPPLKQTPSIKSEEDDSMRTTALSELRVINIPQVFSFVHQPPSTTIFHFDLKDASTISSGALDAEIKSTLKVGVATAESQYFRVVRTDALARRKRTVLLEARENRRAERDKRRVLAVKNRVPTASTAGGSTASSVSSGSAEKMRCLRCLTLETPQWRYIHKGRYCNACYMRVKRWVENNRPGRKLPSRVKNPLPPEEDARLQRDADDLVAQAFEALERQGI